MKRGITLIAPRLGRWAEAGLSAGEMTRQAPNLARLLRLGQRQPASPCGLDRLLIDALDWKMPDLPWAEALRQARGPALEPGAALRFRLVHLRADISNAVLHPVSADPEELSRLINDLNDEFNVDSSFFECAAGDGLLFLKSIEPPRGLPHVRDLYGQALAAWSEQQRRHRDWYRLHNEMQMLLHLHPVNRQRERQGRPLINGLWCWGAGDARRGAAINADLVTDDAELQALGDCLGLRRVSPEALAAGPASRHCLVLWTGWLRILQEGVAESPEEALAAFDRELLRPLLAAGQPIHLLTGDGVAWRYRPLDRFRFWRASVDWHRLGAPS